MSKTDAADFEQESAASQGESGSQGGGDCREKISGAGIRVAEASLKDSGSVECRRSSACASAHFLLQP